jgi:hypothetical protein
MPALSDFVASADFVAKSRAFLTFGPPIGFAGSGFIYLKPKHRGQGSLVRAIYGFSALCSTGGEGLGAALRREIAVTVRLTRTFSRQLRFRDLALNERRERVACSVRLDRPDVNEELLRCELG